jgi:RNA polymerase sigma-70 factor (ECF subfamily)
MSPPEEPFGELMRRVQAGDGSAAADLVHEYEPEIRRTVRMWLTDPQMLRILDSSDICQSVFANFFVRVRAGQFDLQHPQQLLKLLMTMAYNKVKDQARKQLADRRDNRRVETTCQEILEAVVDPAESPSQIAAWQELLHEARSQLTEEERYLAEQRALGRDWTELAQEQTTTPDALRKKLTRAMTRVLRHLGLDDTPLPP